MLLSVFGSKVKPTVMKCGGWTDCHKDHTFWAPQDVMVLAEAQHLDDLCDEHMDPEALEQAVAKGMLVVVEEKNAVVPTVLGMWYEDAAAN